MKIINTQEIYQTNWLSLKESHYLNRRGKTSRWQFVERKNNQKVVTIIAKSISTGKILLIRQYRIPIKTEQIEFPSGLVDIGETLENAALRELKEETGYKAIIDQVSPLLPKSAGLTTEETALVFCSAEESITGQQTMDADEDITIFWLHRSDFFSFIQKLGKKVKVSLDVYAYFAGLNTI